MFPHRQRVVGRTLATAMAAALSLSAWTALAQGTLTIGGATGPSVEVNLDAIYGGASRPAYAPPSPGVPNRSRGLLIPNLHDPDTGAVIGAERVNLVPPPGVQSAPMTASRPQPMPAATQQRITSARVPPAAQRDGAAASPPTPTAPPIRRSAPKPEMAMIKPAPAPIPPPAVVSAPKSTTARTLAPAAPVKPMVEKMAKPMPEPPALPPVPAAPSLPDSAMPQRVTPSSAAVDRTAADTTMSARSSIDKVMADRAIKPGTSGSSARRMADAPPPAPTAKASPPAPARSLSPPAAPTRVASLPGASDGVMQLRFGSGSAAISTADEATLKSLANELKASEDRIQLRAYADDSGGNASKARRLSLSRALAVRSYLIESGLRSTRIDVRALGAVPDGGPADRVDIIRLDR